MYDDYVLETLSSVLEHINIGIIIYDINEEVKFLNNTVKDVFQIEEEVVVGKAISDILPKYQQVKMFNRYKSESNSTINLEEKIILFNSAELVKNNQLIGTICVFKDITELKKAQAQLNIEKDSTEILRTALDMA